MSRKCKATRKENAEQPEKKRKKKRPSEVDS